MLGRQFQDQAATIIKMLSIGMLRGLNRPMGLEGGCLTQRGCKIMCKCRNVPGPGSYDNSKYGFSKIGGIMSRDLRLSAEKSEVPGPGTYNGKETYVKSQNPSFSLPKSSRDMKLYSEAPGPGNYESP